MDADMSFMERALELARLSQSLCRTNPPVGAVLTRDGSIIGQGYHRGPGTPHAEIAAFADAARNGADSPGLLRGATLYCTLEPCCHSGPGKRTPPCTEAIIAAGISRVVFASWDPNPLVLGKGAARLRRADIHVEQGLLSERADALIEPFSVSIKLRRPFVRLKWGQSLDGRIACANGASRWITHGQARVLAHELRATHDAVMIGAGTLRADDPELTVRAVPVAAEQGMRQPLRVVCAGRAPLPLSARVFSPVLREGTLVIASPSSPAALQCASAGIPVLNVRDAAGGLPDPAECLRALYVEGVGSVLVEGGSALLTAFLAGNEWDTLSVFMAPLVLGEGIPAVGDLGIGTPDLGIKLHGAHFQVLDDGLRLDARRKGARDVHGAD